MRQSTKCLMLITHSRFFVTLIYDFIILFKIHDQISGIKLFDLVLNMKSPYYLLVLLLVTACNSSQKEEQTQEKELQTKLLKVHDRIMPEMESIFHKETALNQVLKTIRADKKINKSLDTTTSSIHIRASLSMLKAADDSMMNWMDKLDLDFSQKNHKQIMAYLSLNYNQVGQIDLAVKKALESSDLPATK